MMKITIVGTGYVGLVTGTCFAEIGVNVTCVDTDHLKIENLKKGIIPIFEPGLGEMVYKNSKMGRLHFTTNLAFALKGSEVVFIAVGTPPDKDGSADMKYVWDVTREVAKNIDDYILLVTKSTVPVGTSKKIKKIMHEEIKKRKLKIEFDVASNPEFLKEGAAIDDFMRPDRIVIGVESKKAEKLLRKLYVPFTMNGHPIITMDTTSCELTKYAANGMLATKISFMNDIANLCEKIGANVNLVRIGIGSDPRIGDQFLYPGIGYGGSCFPKDVKALIKTASDNNYNLKILKAVEEVNERQKLVLYQKIANFYNDNLKDKKIALWGLSFKPKTDDMREAPSLILIEKLLNAGAQIIAYDPAAMKEAKRILGNKIVFAKNQYDAIKDAHCLVILTEWSEFKFPDFNIVKNLLKEALVFDGRNIYDAKEMSELGFKYFCIGLNINN